ncbi:hypothetical protein [Kiloniella litopenaei]|uniref:hypothetical protein n=1 Tax=Kiloniella litopenaei TaxID=1549748 RepID=UPI00195289B4|nr:hypothetical protein [Kiloniella litopenaei]
MDNYFPSILNDAIGPVMRGASSSHVAAAYRIGRLGRDYMGLDHKGGNLSRVLIEYDPNGSLEPTHDSQGSDMGLFTGLMGWDITDDRMVDARKHLEANGTDVQIAITDYGAIHPNTYKLTLTSDTESCCILAISIGGGIVEIIAIDDIKPPSLAITTRPLSGTTIPPLINILKNFPASIAFTCITDYRGASCK